MREHRAKAPSLALLAERYALAPGVVDQLLAFGDLLAHDDLAPTTVRDPYRVRDDHLADALVALELDAVNSAKTLADVGSGAGVPGIPLAATLPNAAVTLLDASIRKCEFMSHAVARMGLANVTVMHSRAETWTAGIATCDIVTARALAPIDVVLEYAAPLLRISGSVIVWRGRRDSVAEAAGDEAARVLGLEPMGAKRVVPYRDAENRYLHSYLKVAETPPRFPRRDGVARKRPLGSS